MSPSVPFAAAHMKRHRVLTYLLICSSPPEAWAFRSGETDITLHIYEIQLHCPWTQSMSALRCRLVYVSLTLWIILVEQML